MDQQISDALQEAIDKAGGQQALADLITTDALRVQQSTVSMWVKRQKVPAEYCPRIERFTGVSCERLNPKTDWACLREMAGA